MIKNLVRNYLLISLTLFGVDWILPNISLGYPTGAAFSWEGFGAGLPVLLATSLVLTLLTLVARPLLKFITAPINFLSLGLFNIVIDVFLFWLTNELVPGFSITALSLGNVHLGAFFSYATVAIIFGFLQGCLTLIL